MKLAQDGYECPAISIVDYPGSMGTRSVLGAKTTKRIHGRFIQLETGNTSTDDKPYAWSGFIIPVEHAGALSSWLETHCWTWADALRQEFPGLVDGETTVNGADLVDWLTHNMPRGCNV